MKVSYHCARCYGLHEVDALETFRALAITPFVMWSASCRTVFDEARFEITHIPTGRSMSCCRPFTDVRAARRYMCLLSELEDWDQVDETNYSTTALRLGARVIELRWWLAREEAALDKNA